MRFVFALVAFNALLALASAVTYGSLEPVGRHPGVASSNNSIVENGGYHLTHHKPRFSDRNFDYDSLVDAETENADRLEEENSPLLQQSSENENGADNDNEVETTEENGINIVKNTFVGGPSTRRKKDLYVGPEDKAKGKQVENTKVKKDSVHGNTRRKKQLSKPNTTPKVTPTKIMALTVILMLAVVNPFNLFLVYPAMKAMNKDHHPPERTIISLNSLTKCETSNKDPTQKLCKIEMDDTDYGGQYEIYVKTPNDDDHLSLITKVDPDECKVGTNVVIEKWHTGEVRARCEKNVGLVDLDHPQNKIKLNPEEAKKVKKYETENIIRRSLLYPEDELFAQNKDIETSRISQNYRFFQHPSFYELEKKRRQMSEERLKSYSHSTHSSNLLRTKSGNGIDTLPENHRRYLSQKSLHVHSHIVPTAKLQNSKSAEETNPWNENNRKLKEGLSGYSNKGAFQNFEVPRSETTFTWNDFKHVDGRSKFQGVGIEKADETNKKSTEQEVEDNEQDEVKN